MLHWLAGKRPTQRVRELIRCCLRGYAELEEVVTLLGHEKKPPSEIAAKALPRATPALIVSPPRVTVTKPWVVATPI